MGRYDWIKKSKDIYNHEIFTRVLHRLIFHYSKYCRDYENHCFYCPHQILIEEQGNFKDSIGSNQTSVGVGITAFKISTDRGNYERANKCLVCQTILVWFETAT